MWLGGHLSKWVFGFEWYTWEIKVVLVLDEGKREEDEKEFRIAKEGTFWLKKSCIRQAHAPNALWTCESHTY